MNAPCDSECGQFIRDFYAEHDIEVFATTARPVVWTPYDTLNMVCPHGVTWFAQPTSEQIVKWQEAGA